MANYELPDYNQAKNELVSKQLIYVEILDYLWLVIIILGILLLEIDDLGWFGHVLFVVQKIVVFIILYIILHLYKSYQ